MEHAGIERTTLMCLKERSILRASVHSTVSMGTYYSGATIEHHHRAAAAAADSVD